MMIQEKTPLFDKKQTARKMYFLIERYYHDIKNFYIKKGNRMIPLHALTLREFFNYVRSIPYRQDTKPIEIVSRPKHILRNELLGMDCKKKGILISSFLRSKKIPYRLIGSSKKKNKRIHHVFPQARIRGRWRNVDATYRHYRPFEKKKVTNYERL